METRMQKIFCDYNRNIALRVYEGHFVTPHSHITHYFDMTTLRTRVSEASAVAAELAKNYAMNTIVDTIICMDGTEVIGAYLAKELTSAGIMIMNAHQTIYVVSPEFNANGQIIFRDNLKPMIRNKNVLVLVASATTGDTLRSCVECVQYYGGTVGGVSAIFSAIDEIDGIHVNSIFSSSQVPQYHSYTSRECPCCRDQQKVDAIVNGFGYSRL